MAGKPAKPKPKRKREIQLSVRVTPEEYAAFRERAEVAGQALGNWIRMRCREALGMPTK